MTAYYNEIDPYASAWLRNLADAGHVAPGTIDDRSIADVRPDDIGDGQAHFFAGIGGWSLALRLAGVPDDAAVWTGSCPCQPFSAAGRGRGADDERHLWPVWYRLIAECRPSIVFGEQVASPAGRRWLAAVRADLEAVGYGVGAADLCAAGVGAPHIRQRLWWVAIRMGYGSGPRLEGYARDGDNREEPRWINPVTFRPVAAPGSGVSSPWMRVVFAADCCEDGCCPVCGDDYGDCGCPGPTMDEYEYIGDFVGARPVMRQPWSDVEWVDCSDGKRRPFEPGTFPLAHGVSNRVGRLRAYGNAIVPQLAAAFIVSALEAIQEAA